MALDGSVCHVGVLNGGRWCNAYPLGIDLVRGAYGPRYSMCPTTSTSGVCGSTSTHI